LLAAQSGVLPIRSTTVETPSPAEPGLLDDDFVARAPAKELPGTVRAQRAYRIASDHRTVTPWRALEPSPAHLAPCSRRARHRRDAGRALLTVGLVVGLLVWLHLTQADRFLTGPVNEWAAGAPDVPVPADAAGAPLGRPAAAPAGEGGFAFLFEHGGRPVAFDPCRPVHYVVRYDGAPAGAEQLVESAVAQLSAATGLVLVFDGPSDEVPAADRNPHQPERYGDRWAPVLLAWSDGQQDAELAGHAAGYASPVALDPDGRGPRIVTGQVVLDAEHSHADVVLTTLLHELGHLAGLGHVDDPADVMHAQSTLTGGYTAGALRGLHQLGQGRCFG
jgi:hypothetical protein